MTESESNILVPYHNLPEESIEGQHGLIKHVVLNDRRRVLTLDTAGEVMLWDLLRCQPIKSFGKRHLEDVEPEVNTLESVANWCSIDTRTGTLAVVLEEIYCFDAEAYLDELELKDPVDFRDDQRVNLGRWVLRWLFVNLIEEEVRRDEMYRNGLTAKSAPSNGIRRDQAPLQLNMPSSAWPRIEDDGESAITPRPANGYPAITPGLAIGIATPAALPTNNTTAAPNHLPPTAEEGDYFSSNPPPPNTAIPNGKTAVTPGTAPVEMPQSPSDPDKDSKSSSLFGKKFRFPKKLGRTSTEVKPVVVDERAEESDKSSEKEDKIVEDNFYGIIQKIRNDYDEYLLSEPQNAVASGIVQSSLSETPKLTPSPSTTLIIQEDRPDSGGVADLYRGTVGCVGQDADLIEKAAPMWLGDLLLKNQIPLKDTVKVSFVLQPFQDLLPSIASTDGNSRLNANRMLRAKKVLAYVAERISPPPEQPDANALKPEEYLDLYCQNQIIPHLMTLATIRAHVWKTGGDVLLFYRSNGRRPSIEVRAVETPEEKVPTDASGTGEIGVSAGDAARMGSSHGSGIVASA